MMFEVVSPALLLGVMESICSGSVGIFSIMQSVSLKVSREGPASKAHRNVCLTLYQTLLVMKRTDSEMLHEGEVHTVAYTNPYGLKHTHSLSLVLKQLAASYSALYKISAQRSVWWRSGACLDVFTPVCVRGCVCDVGGRVHVCVCVCV